MTLPKLFQANHDAPTAHIALLMVRIQIGLTLFCMSGLPKLTHFSAQGDPLHLGALAAPAMLYAAFALGVCSLLVVAGLATRYAAFFATVSLAVTFFVIERGPLTTDPFSPGHDTHPEVTFLYMVMFLAVIFTGPGRFSLDQRLSDTAR